MKKIIFVFAITLCGCGGIEEKQISKSDSLSMAIDSTWAGDTLLLKLQQETSTKIKTK